MTLPNVLGVFAHPDDETIMAGGTLAMLHQSAIPTHLVITTRGEGGEAGVPPVVTDRRELGARREAELRCAITSLGVTSLSLLGYVDPDVGPENTLSPFEADFDTLVSQIVEAIEAHRADVVIAHGPDGEYGHPAHKLVHRATAVAIARCAPDLAFYTVMARPPAPIAGDDDHLWNASRLAHFWLDISPWADAKVAAMECHLSQHDLFKRRRKLQTVPEALRRIESFYRELPAVDGALPNDAFAAALLAAGAIPVNDRAAD